MAKVLELQVQHQSFNEHSRLISFKMDWISLQSKGLSRVFSNSIVQKHQFFGTQPSLWPNSDTPTWHLKQKCSYFNCFQSHFLASNHNHLISSQNDFVHSRSSFLLEHLVFITNLQNHTGEFEAFSEVTPWEDDFPDSQSALPCAHHCSSSLVLFKLAPHPRMQYLFCLFP